MGLGALGVKIIAVAVAVVLFLAIGAGTLWAMDYAVGATVVDKDCRLTGESTVTVQVKVFGAEHTQPIGSAECGVIQEGNYVLYNIRSERIRIWGSEADHDAGADPLWDSEWL